MLSCITLRYHTQIVLTTYNGLPFFPASSLFHDQLRFNAFSFAFLPHPFSFCFPLPLFHLSLLLMLCHCANEEEQKEKGGMNLGHRRPCISSLHSATIKRKLICGSPAFPFPLASSPDGHTHTHTCAQGWVSPWKQCSSTSWIHHPFSKAAGAPTLRAHKCSMIQTHWVSSLCTITNNLCAWVYVRLCYSVSQFKTLPWYESNLW